MASIYIPEAFNIFVGTDANASKHLQVTEITLPVLEEKTAEHHAGGSIGALEIGGLGLNALTQGFNLSGYDAPTMSQFGVLGAAIPAFTTYGVIRDTQGNAPIELKAVVWGRLTKLELSALKRGDLATQTHQVKEVVRYQLTWNGAEKFYYDFFGSIWRIDGVDQNAASNAILRIPSAG